MRSPASERSPVDLVATSGGTVYGLTAGGGDFGNGTIFAIDPSDNFSTRYSLPPSAGTGMTSLVRGSDARFYGTAGGGGDAGFGTVFTVDDAGTLTVLHSFAGRAQSDGETPVGLIQGRDGRLYGTTRSGGQFGDGTVYSIDLTGDYRLLHSFNASVDGAQPESDLLHASDGNFYGVTRSPTASRLFRIDSSGTFTPLNNLTGFSPGALSEAGGRLFIPTAAGGVDNGGTVLAKELGETALTLFFDFTVGQGAAGSPNGIIQSRNGLFYGTTGPLGAPGNVRTLGTVFVMDAAGERTALHAFDSDISQHIDVGTPRSNLFEGRDGNFYGTTNSQSQSGNPPGQYLQAHSRRRPDHARFSLQPAGRRDSSARRQAVRSDLYWTREHLHRSRDSFSSRTQWRTDRSPSIRRQLIPTLLFLNCSRRTTGVCTASRRAVPALNRTGRSSAWTRLLGHSRSCTASAGPMVPSQLAG